MYRWYQSANKCYAYLFDVKAKEPESFAQSSWFTRGWTLQELIAPKHVMFYDAGWSELGSKITRATEGTAATGINEQVLRNHESYRAPKACIAQKMYWASGRQTSSPEDKAYCLLGLFNINIPLLYGEGIQKAFLRLQKELLVTTTDETILAWTSTRVDLGLLAREPREFAASHDVRKYSMEDLRMRPPWMITNIGFQFTLMPGTWAYSTPQPSQTGVTTILVKLRCRKVGTEGPIILAFSKVDHQYRWRRIRHDQSDTDFPTDGMSETETIYIHIEALNTDISGSGARYKAIVTLAGSPCFATTGPFT